MTADFIRATSPGPSRRTCLGILAGLAGVLSCAPAAPLTHDAYVWQQRWVPELARSVEELPAPLQGLRVLAGSGRRHEPAAVDLVALAAMHRPVTAVLRVDGTATPPDAAVAEVADVAERWRRQGVNVRGIEIDHDCPASRLADYARWLEGQRPAARGLRLSITALPSWSGAPGLERLVAAVDDVVVQVHTVEAPVLFEAVRARRYLESWARATRHSFRVALPTYTAQLRDGTELSADPRELAAFVAGLRSRPVPGLTGVSWFRLGHEADARAWSTTTLAAVATGAALDARVSSRLVGSGHGTFDVIVENTGNADGRAPARLALAGQVDVLEGVRGYMAEDGALVIRRPPAVAAGRQIVVGFVRGKGVEVASR